MSYVHVSYIYIYIDKRKKILGLKQRAVKILTYQWGVMMVQKYASW